jgi:hypothetical protein
MPGPPPKKEGARRRRNKSDIATEIVNVDELLVGDVEIPVADEEWEGLTKAFWESFKSSGQVIWMEPTDWMTAYALMEVLDRWLKPQEVKVGEKETAELIEEGIPGESPPVYLEGKEYIFEEKIVAMPGGVLNSILKGLSALMATEGDRRRLRIELERKRRLDEALGNDPKVVSITQNRADAFKRKARG